MIFLKTNKMEFLPDYKEQTNNLFGVLERFPSEITFQYLEHINQYRLFTGLVKSDCWAVIYDGQILYNFYDTSRPYRELIIDNIIRERLVKDPYESLFKFLYKNAKDTKIELYMSEKEGYKVVFEYKQITQSFKINTFV